MAREEIFGPVLVMIPYDSEEEAIAMANDTPYGLAGYVQSGDIEHARAVGRRIRAGNMHSTVPPAATMCPSAASSSPATDASGAPTALRTTSKSRRWRASRPDG
jgi:acyl-CoA reductase-like NAD-dependent aldehyde dehydrogenase